MTAEFEVLRAIHIVADLDDVETTVDMADYVVRRPVRPSAQNKLRPTTVVHRVESPWKTVMRGLLTPRTT
jgi:hypothetical protein